MEKEKKTGQRKGNRKGADEKNLGNGGRKREVRRLERKKREPAKEKRRGESKWAAEDIIGRAWAKNSGLKFHF